MCDWNVPDIVNILMKDKVLLNSRRRFAYLLYIPVIRIKEFEHVYNRENDLRSYFCNILQKWKSANGNDATILALINILRENEFTASADSLTIFCIPAPNLTKLDVKESAFVGVEKELKEQKMCDWNVPDIVKILLQDAALLRAKTQFAEFLMIPEYIIKQLEDDYSQRKDLRSYFSNVLKTWKSANGIETTISSLSNILRDNQFAASAERLSTYIPTLNPATNPYKTKKQTKKTICIPATNLTIFGVKSPISNFVGREKELKKLNELFKEEKASVILSSAMGGKGKTELCRRFIQQLQNDVETLVTWLSGDGAQKFQQSLSKISQSMNVQTKDPEGKPLSIEEIIENISKKRKSKWAVIIDNVDEVFTDFYKAIDAFLRNGAFVVVTSRRSDIHTEERIFLKELEDEDALEFVRSSLKKTPENLIVKLCKCLQNYPLVLQQAVSYIKLNQGEKDESYGIDEYLLELNLDNSKVLDHEIPMTGYEHTIIRVFDLTLSKIVNFNSLILLDILSLVQADGSETKFLKKLFSIFESKELFDSSISSLKSFSLIGVNKGEVSVHRIIQKLTRDRMKSKNNFNLVVNQILENIDIDKLGKKEIIQINQIWENALSESEIIKQNSKLAVKICNRLEEFGLEREGFIEITLEQFVTFLEPDHIDTLRMQFQLGRTLFFNGNRKEGLVKLEEAWEKYKKVLGEEHEETLECAEEIADDDVLNEQGKREKALTIWKQMLESSEKEFGREDLRSLKARYDIAHCLYWQGRFVEAKKEYEELLELRVKVQGEDHADTLDTKDWLSRTLRFLGEKEKALEMMEQLLISREKILGQNHWHTNNTRNTISYWKKE